MSSFNYCERHPAKMLKLIIFFDDMVLDRKLIMMIGEVKMNAQRHKCVPAEYIGTLNEQSN